MNTEEIAQLKAAAEAANGVLNTVNVAADDVESSVKLYQALAKFADIAAPAAVLDLLAEREADKKRIAELEERTLTFIEPVRYECEGYHIDEAYLTPAKDGDCYDREEVLEVLQKCCDTAGIKLTTEAKQ